MLKKSHSYFILLLLLTISCKDKSSTETGTTFPESFQFVWQDESFDDGDELGVYFTDTGIYFWDYFGDSYDQGPDCYAVLLVIEIVSYEGDVYTVEFIDPDTGTRETETVDIQIRDGLLIVGEEGDEIPHSKTNLMPSQLTPACDFDFKKVESDKRKSLLK